MCEGGGLWQKMKKNYIYTVLAALLLAVVAFLFFFPDDIQGNVLQQHDIVQGPTVISLLTTRFQRLHGGKGAVGFIRAIEFEKDITLLIDIKIIGRG